jgi:NaMN:DMB phosphoribosyltransferase
MKEVLERFKEERSRFRDPALTALLNLGLQDMNGSVKALALAILESGYAAGDKTTEKILRTMQNSNNNYSQDALSAANALLKMSQTRALVNDNSVVTTNRKG